MLFRSEHHTEAIEEIRIPDAHTDLLQVLDDFPDAIRRRHEHAQLDDEELQNGRLGQAAAAEGFHGGAHVFLDARRERSGGAAEVVIAADDVADELDGGDDVLVEAAREEERRGGDLAGLEAEGGEEVELGAEDPFGIDNEDRRGGV